MQKAPGMSLPSRPKCFSFTESCNQTLLILIISEKERVCNTRLNPQNLTSHLDYLRITVIIDLCKLHELLMYCSHKYISLEEGSRWHCGRSFDNKIVSPVGINGGYTINLETKKVDVMINFTGQYFQGETVTDQWRLLLGLKHTYNVKCCRIDLSVDDYTYKHIPVRKMLEACDNKLNFGFKKQSRSESRECGEKWETTEYFGSRESDKLVRVYDHEGEFLRFEAEFKKEKAQCIFDILTSIERDWFGEEFDCMDANKSQCTYQDFIKAIVGKRDVCVNLENITKGLHGCKDRFDIILQRIIGSIAVSSIDFRHETTRKDKSKGGYKDRERCSFYQEFMDKVGSEIKVKVPPKKVTIQKRIAWKLRSVSRTESILRDALGALDYAKYSNGLIENGRSRQTISDMKLIEFLKDNKELCFVGI